MQAPRPCFDEEHVTRLGTFSTKFRQKFSVNNQLIKVYFARLVNSLIKSYSEKLRPVTWSVTSLSTCIESVPGKLLISCTTVGAESDENSASSMKQRRMQFPQINNQFLEKSLSIYFCFGPFLSKKVSGTF